MPKEIKSCWSFWKSECENRHEEDICNKCIHYKTKDEAEKEVTQGKK